MSTFRNRFAVLDAEAEELEREKVELKPSELNVDAQAVKQGALATAKLRAEPEAKPTLGFGTTAISFEDMANSLDVTVKPTPPAPKWNFSRLSGSATPAATDDAGTADVVSLFQKDKAGNDNLVRCLAMSKKAKTRMKKKAQKGASHNAKEDAKVSVNVQLPHVDQTN